MKFFKLLFRVGLVFILPVHAFSNVEASQDGQGKTVPIGLLIADSKSLEAKRGAELAIRLANEKGGYKSMPFRLVVRSMEGPWGTGSKQAVDLIFEEEVWALMGSHDGRNAHLVEQVATKSNVIFLSAWSGDPTLSQAFVPWFFNCVPNDLQQASALIEEIHNKRKIRQVVTISDNDYDSRLAVESYVKKSTEAGKPVPLQLFYDAATKNFNPLLDQINKSGAGAVILFGRSQASLMLYQQMQQKRMNPALFGSISVLGENSLPEQPWERFIKELIEPSIHWSGPLSSAFQSAYLKAYGKKPGAVAYFAFDGMNLLIEAIRQSGQDREKIQKSLMRMKFEGATGSIQFDSKGNRL